MQSVMVFGDKFPANTCEPRKAVYAVIPGKAGRVAAAQGRSCDGREMYWLPGGGIEPGESPIQALMREVREELGRGAHIQKKLGEAIQFFYAEDDDKRYRMTAYFYLATFDETPITKAESELHWVKQRSPEVFFHECHAWAASLAPHEDFALGDR